MASIARQISSHNPCAIDADVAQLRPCRGIIRTQLQHAGDAARAVGQVVGLAPVGQRPLSNRRVREVSAVLLIAAGSCCYSTVGRLLRPVTTGLGKAESAQSTGGWVVGRLLQYRVDQCFPLGAALLLGLREAAKKFVR